MQQHQCILWVGTGIGITPFLSMLSFERSNLDFRRISLYYVARGAEDAVYDREIRASCSRAGFAVDYVLWLTSERGRLTAKRIAEDVVRDDYAVMLCGNMAFVDAFTDQFRALGLPRERIITEELQFRRGPDAPVVRRSTNSR